MKHSICILIFSFFTTIITAQNSNILFTVNGNPTYVSEFKRVYNKNLDLVKDESQKDVQNYLDLFIKYKLKLEEARALELDKKSSYLREFNSYKAQLTRNYLTNNKVTEALVEEAYERMKTEVDASHVLVRIDVNASPQDTLLAYEEINKLRARVLNEGYKTVQKDVHNGQTIYAEDLGYFSAFKMVYDFENVAFNTKEGEVSQPFRTRFGYHILQVNAKRKAQGEVTVAHIMVINKGVKGQQPELLIEEIYKRIQQGESFEALAKQFSDDKSSAKNGGKMNPFTSGQLSSAEFEAVAFGLQKESDISKPFKTDFGYHIIKLIKKEGLKPFKELKANIQDKVKRDSRSKVINDSRVKTLMQRYNVTKEQPALKDFVAILNDTYFSKKWTIPTRFDVSKPLLKIGNKQLLYKDFASFIMKGQRRNQPKINLEQLVANNYSLFVDSNLKQYQEENLEQENKEYAQVLAEYRDGLLLFDLMETEIWSISKSDTVALKDFYNANYNKYFFNERIDATVASSAKKSVLKKVAKLLKQDFTQEQIKAKINTNNKVNVSFTEGILDINHQALPKGLNLKAGVSKVVKHNDAFVVVNIKEVLPKAQKTFEQAKGKVINDFQENKEKTWLEALAKKYTVNINKDVLNKVKQSINN